MAGESVTLCLADEVDVSRGDVIASATAPPAVADQFETHIVWMSEEEMLPGRRYLVKIGATTVGATIDQPKHQVNVNTLEHVAAKTLELNQIGICNVYLDHPVPFDPYDENRDMGGFIIIDRMTNNTVGAGLVHFALRRADNVHWQASRWTGTAHATLKGQRPGGRMVHRALRRGQVDHRQHRRAQTARRRPAHLPARRRQPPARPQQGPRLHRG